MSFNAYDFLRSQTEGMNAEQFCEYLLVNGLVKYTAARNIAIREYYHNLKCGDWMQAEIQTADAFCLSPDYIYQIIHNRKYRAKGQAEAARQVDAPNNA